MKQSQTGYLMALLAGVAIVGASTAGVAVAKTHHDNGVTVSLAAEADSEASAASAAESSASTTSASAAAPSTSDSTVAGSSSTPTKAPSSTGSATAVASATKSSAAVSKPSTSAASSVPKTAASTTSSAATSAAVASKYKDGTYTATGSYQSPEGTEKLGVTLSLAGDKVTKSTLALEGVSAISTSYQGMFQSGYLSQVIGKDIDSISVGTISGSSLTGIGFTEAQKQIEKDALA